VGHGVDGGPYPTGGAGWFVAALSVNTGMSIRDLLGDEEWFDNQAQWLNTMAAVIAEQNEEVNAARG
jgi:hypothetical protein